MKCFSKLAFIVFVLGIRPFAHSQNLRLSGYGSYVLEGTYNIYYENGDYYNGKTDGGWQWGVAAEYLLSPSYGVELSAFRRATHVSEENSANRINADLRLNYFLFGLNAYPKTHSQKLQGYGGASLGAVIQNAYNTNTNAGSWINRTVTKFTWAARLGGIWWLCDGIGLKTQAQWLSSLQLKKGGAAFNLYRNNPQPADFSIANQFEIDGGFIIKLGKCGQNEKGL
jgi:hypothetical protein